MKPKFDHKIKRPNGYWVPSGSTDVRKTIRKEQERLKEQANKVTPLKDPKCRTMTRAGCGWNRTGF